MQSESPVLEISNLEFSYGDQPLLNIEEFEVAANERVAVLGPSGCGKTTFMHLITGLLRPRAGTVRIRGTDIANLSEAKIDHIRGENIGIVFQRLHLVPSITVLENLLLAQRLARCPIDREYALELLARLGIEALATRKPPALSQGQAQRVAIARAVAHRPSLLVADEPTSALDDGNAADALSVLSDLTISSGAALVLVTHDGRVREEMDRIFSLEASS